MRRAEESRLKAEELTKESAREVAELKEKITAADEERKKLAAEREKLQAGAKRNFGAKWRKKPRRRKNCFPKWKRCSINRNLPKAT